MSPGAVVAALAGSVRRPALVAAAGLAAVTLLGAAAAFGSGLGAAGARAAAVLALLAFAAALLGRRQKSHLAARSLSLDARQPLGRDCGVAVIRTGGKCLLVGYGTAGTRVLADLSRREVP